MGSTASRHAPRPASGLFADPRPIEAVADMFANVWQVGYVATDLDRAMEEAAQTLGLEHCIEVPTDTAEFVVDGEVRPWETRIAMGSRGGLIVEIIEPVRGEVGFYRDYLPQDGSYGLRLHHLAAFMEPGDEAWAAMEGVLAGAGLKVDSLVLIPGRVRAGYVDTSAQLGHWMEICQLQPDDIATFTGIVRDSS
jgi:hypothetical protein